VRLVKSKDGRGEGYLTGAYGYEARVLATLSGV
jgi:hypothetical protein